MARLSPLLVALSLSACTAAKMREAHANAAAALGCPRGRTLLFQDDDGYQALGCGAIARCPSAQSCERVAPASCRAVAEFDDRLCQALAAQPRQGIFIEQWAARTRDENLCEERYRAEVSMCPARPPGRSAAVAQSVDAERVADRPQGHRAQKTVEQPHPVDDLEVR